MFVSLPRAARRPRSRRRAPRGAAFSLPELLVCVLLAGVVSAAMVQALLLEIQASQRLGRLLRERQLGQRALELLRGELQQAGWAAGGQRVPAAAACPLAGRQVVLQLGTASGVVTYSLGPAPDAIWRGRVLMRCGPAYGLDGALAAAQPQHRVLLDAMAADGLGAEPRGPAGMLELRLRRELAPGQPLQQQLLLLAPFGD
jgi:type II secretory pathway pseudopilin PulG